MAREKNIYRIDDVLIKAGTVIGSVVALAILGFSMLSSDEFHKLQQALGFGVLGLFGVALAPVGLLLAGFHVRNREKRVLALFSVLDRQLELRVRDFVANTEFTRVSLAKTLIELNESGLGYYVWDRDADVIQDALMCRG